MRKLIDADPFVDMSKDVFARGKWPAQWIGHPDVRGQESAITAYRLPIMLDGATRLRIHVSADERYELYLDGARIGRGPERGDRHNWFYETYELDLPAGRHVLVAKTWWLGPDGPAPYAQMSIRPGFLLAAEGVAPELLNTGTAKWEAKRLAGYSNVPPEMTWGTGAKTHIRGEQWPRGFEKGDGDGWVPVVAVGPAGSATFANEFPRIWRLKPAMLPPMAEIPMQAGIARHVQAVQNENTRDIPVRAADNISAEAQAWSRMLMGGAPLTIPPHTRRRAIVDLGNYFTAYPELTVSGGRGAKVEARWAESLFGDPKKGVKGNRDEVEGKFFVGVGDIFEPEGGRSRVYETLWWESGRYVEFLVTTADEALVIENWRVRETHYPYDFESRFEASDPRLAEVVPLAKRVMEMCSHETYMDCPYYEQLQYVGDTRLEVLTTYALTRDDRLPRKALLMFDQSRPAGGLTQSRYPSRITQVIPPFSLWWVAMVHDFAMWRGDMAFVRQLMPGVRAVLDAFRGFINKDGLVQAPNGWNFMDWVWHWGIPPEGDLGVSGMINWQMVLVLRQAAELEAMIGECELASRNRKSADQLAATAAEAFWDESRGLLADDLAKKNFSEHTQCLAFLASSVARVGDPGLAPVRSTGSSLPASQEQPKGCTTNGLVHGLFADPNLSRTTIYFVHYLFEVCRLTGRMDRFFDRLGMWLDLKRNGLRTTIETPEPSRSDCHAWGAHPVFHYLASVLGIRPAAPGFAQVRIEPQLGPLTWARGAMPHPRGFVSVDLAIRSGKLAGSIELPEGVGGTLVLGREVRPLKPGRQEI